MPVLVRSWNLFHGNSVPAGRHDHLERMVRLVSADGPDVVLLQELPVWALPKLAEWSGMSALGDVARRPQLGPLPSTAGIGRAITELNHGLFRSAFAGQATALLLAPGVRVEALSTLVLNDRAFRRAQARQLALPPLARLAWAKERKTAQVARVFLPDGRAATVANVHATAYRPDDALADAEVLRAAVYVSAFAARDDVIVLGGDFNVTAARSATLAELSGWGYSEPGPGIDHILVRGAEAEPLRVWDAARRRVDGALLSDHAPVELVLP